MDKITKISKTSQQNNWQKVTNEHDKEIPIERNIYLHKKNWKLLMIWDEYNSIIMEYQIC